MCDIDHFKRINDGFGHPTGDQVLRDTAPILSQSVRSRDAVIRWGGEEFVILLDACPRSPAVELAERIRLRIHQHRHVEVGQVSLSIGLATRMPGESMEALIGRADAALYEAKRSGRNRLALAPLP